MVWNIRDKIENVCYVEEMMLETNFVIYLIKGNGTELSASWFSYRYYLLNPNVMKISTTFNVSSKKEIMKMCKFINIIILRELALVVKLYLYIYTFIHACNYDRYMYSTYYLLYSANEVLREKNHRYFYIYQNHQSTNNHDDNKHIMNTVRNVLN